VIDAMSEQSEATVRTLSATRDERDREAPSIWVRFAGLALVMMAFTAIGMFAYSVHTRGAASAERGEDRVEASTLVRASTLRAEPAARLMTTPAPLPVETARVTPAADPRAGRAAAPDGAPTARVRGDDMKAARTAGVKAQEPRPKAPPGQTTKLRYWRATTAEPDVGF
jgi:hypothetical protein